jgi:hypothetical protein
MGSLKKQFAVPCTKPHVSCSHQRDEKRTESFLTTHDLVHPDGVALTNVMKSGLKVNFIHESARPPAVAVTDAMKSGQNQRFAN